jgi:hypothetical protein
MVPPTARRIHRPPNTNGEFPGFDEEPTSSPDLIDLGFDFGDSSEESE